MEKLSLGSTAILEQAMSSLGQARWARPQTPPCENLLWNFCDEVARGDSSLTAFTVRTALEDARCPEPQTRALEPPQASFVERRSH